MSSKSSRTKHPPVHSRKFMSHFFFLFLVLFGFCLLSVNCTKKQWNDFWSGFKKKDTECLAQKKCSYLRYATDITRCSGDDYYIPVEDRDNTCNCEDYSLSNPHCHMKVTASKEWYQAACTDDPSTRCWNPSPMLSESGDYKNTSDDQLPADPKLPVDGSCHNCQKK